MKKIFLVLLMILPIKAFPLDFVKIDKDQYNEFLNQVNAKIEEADNLRAMNEQLTVEISDITVELSSLTAKFELMEKEYKTQKITFAVVVSVVPIVSVVTGVLIGRFLK
jgi:DNA-directed RNA polymerase beta subunit